MSEPAPSAADQSQKTDPVAFLSIIRPQNCIIGGLTVIAGLAMAYKMAPIGADILMYLPQFLFGYFAYFMIAAGGNVVNDIFDIEVDRVNRPHRALPSGRMTVKQAWYYVAFLSILGVILAWLNKPFGVYGPLIVLVFIVIGYAYAAKVKTFGLAGNFMVAFSFAFGVFYGAIVYGEVIGHPFNIPLPIWLFFVTAFMILQARETIKGAEDVEGDDLRDVRTIARVYGYETAAVVAAILNLIGATCFVLVWVLNFASWDLWPLMLLGAGIVVGAAIAPLTGPGDKKRLLIGSTLDKIGALVGLIAFIVIPLYEVFFLV